MGLAFTPASRSLIFFYTHAFWVALGAHFLLKNDRLTPAKLVGLVLALQRGGGGVPGPLAGTAAPVLDRGPDGPVCGHILGRHHLVCQARHRKGSPGSLSNLVRPAHLLLSPAGFGLGSVRVAGGLDLNLVVLTSLFYQSVVVAFFSYLVWFWLIHRHTVSRLAAFTFMAPLFGVILGGLVLDEPVTLLVWVGLACVAGGLFFVNR